jgi:aspartate ammonia-lyase
MSTPASRKPASAAAASTADFRLERDSLGELRVPADAYYGVQTARAIANFPISGLTPALLAEGRRRIVAHGQPDPGPGYGALVEAYVQIKKAAALVNAELGMLDGPRATAIVKAADHVLKGNLREQWVVDVFQAGAGTSFNMNTNEVLANYANEQFARKPEDKARGAYTFVNPNDHVNMAQSTNDTMPTAIRLSNLLLLPRTLAALDALDGAFAAKGREFRDVITTGRTHLQDATPITLGQVFTAFADCVRKARGRIADAAAKLQVIGLGGTAVGTGMNSDPRYAPAVAKQLGVQLGLKITSAKNLIELQNSLADQLEFSASLRALAVDLTRIVNDLRLMASGPTCGIGEINLPPVQPGSSIMPGKVNPVMLEMTNMVCYQALGLDSAVCACAQAGQFQLNVMMPLVAFNLLQMQTILGNACREVAIHCVNGITANVARSREFFEKSYGLATVLNPVIGYSAAAAIVKHAVKNGTPIMDELRAAKQENGKPLLTEAELKAAFKPERLTRPGSLKK